MGQSSGKLSAPRVFAIPELLEAILLHLSWSDLFVLQRVNKAFHQVIAESAKLREIMALHVLGSSKTRDVQGASSLLREFSWSFLNYEPFPGDSTVTTGRDTTIKLIYDLWLPPSSAPRTSHYGLGVGQQKRFYYSVDSHGTWRLLKLTAAPGKVWIHINVIFHVDRSFGLAYRELIALQADTATFGDLADVLWEMKHRLPEEHIKVYRARSPTVKLKDFMDAKCIRGDSRERVAAVVAWEGARPDPAASLIERKRESKRRERREREVAKREAEEQLERDFSGPW